MEATGRSSDSGLPLRRLPRRVAQWLVTEGVSPHSGGTVPDFHRVPSPFACWTADYSLAGDMDHGEVTDRQLEALLARLDRVVEELARMNAREERREELTVIAHELRNLNESLQAITYAALGAQGPQVRRRRGA
jgi:hypothetical protein